MTLGCGGYGGNITSDNISPRHLLNIKRLAYETTPGAVVRRRRGPPAGGGAARRLRAPPNAVRDRGGAAGPADRRVPGVARLHAAGRPRPPRPALRRRRLPRPAAVRLRQRRRAAAPTKPAERQSRSRPTSYAKTTSGRRCGRGARSVIGERTIVTPAARDLGEAAPVFVQAGWPR